MCSSKRQAEQPRPLALRPSAERAKSAEAAVQELALRVLFRPLALQPSAERAKAAGPAVQEPALQVFFNIYAQQVPVRRQWVACPWEDLCFREERVPELLQ